MAQRFIRPGRSSSDRGGVYDDESPIKLGGNSGSSDSGTKDTADRTLGNIDDVLADNDAFRAGLGSDTSDDVSSEPVDGPAAGGDRKPTKPEAKEAAQVASVQNEAEDDGSWDTNVSKRAVAKKKARNIAFALGATGVIVSTFVALSTFLLPYKMTHILENISKQVGNVPQSAVENRLEYYMTRYLMLRALRSQGVPDDLLRRRFSYLGSSFWGTMYTNWQGAKLEDALLRENGVRLVPTGDGGVRNGRLIASEWRLEFEGLGRNNPLQGQTLDRTNARRFVKTFANDQVKAKNVFRRWHERRLMKNYYGISNWKPHEKKRDEVRNKYLEKKRDFKKRLSNETVGRVSQRLDKYVSCIVDGDSARACRESLKEPEPTKITDPELEEVLDNAIEEGGDDVDLGSRELRDKISDLMTKFGTKKVLTSVVSGVGIVSFLTNTYDSLDSGKLNQVVADKNAQQYVAFAAPLMSSADQFKAGGITGEADFDLEDVRISHEILGSYTESPLYKSTQGSTAGVVSAQNTQYYADCDNEEGKETLLDPGEVICPQRKIVVNKTAFTENSVWRALEPIVNAWNSTAGEVLELINGAIDGVIDVSGVDSVIQRFMEASGLNGALQNGFELLLNWIAGTVVDGTEEDGEAYENIYGAMSSIQSDLGGGAGVAKEDTIGGGYLTTEQVAAIRNQNFEDEQWALTNSSFFDRYLSPSTEQSITGQLALHMPTSTAQAGQTMASLFTKPLSVIGNVFSSITIGKASAQLSMPTSNPFGVPYFGYSLDHDVFTANNGEGMDPQELQTRYRCSRDPEDRPQNDEFREADDIVPFEVPSTADPCFLEEAVVDAGTRYITGNLSLGGSSTSSNAPTGNNPGGSIIGDPYSDTTSVPCAPGTTDIGEQDAYVGGRMFKSRMCSVSNLPSSGQADNPGSSFSTPGADGHAVVNSRVSGAWYKLAEDARAAGINLSVMSSFRSMSHQQSLWIENGQNTAYVARPGYSSHQAGVAIDFANMSGKSSSSSCSSRATNSGAAYRWLRDNAARYGFKQYVREAWHWDALPDASRC